MGDLTQLRILFTIVGLLAGVLLGYFLWGTRTAELTHDDPRDPGAVCRHDPKTFRCVRYVGNYDGDTVRVSIPGVHPLIGENISVRVLGVDTPEMKGHGRCEPARAKEARDLVMKFLRGAKQIEIRDVQRDKYFRILGDVVADGKSLRNLLLNSGVAYAYDGGTKAKINWCKSE